MHLYRTEQTWFQRSHTVPGFAERGTINRHVSAPIIPYPGQAGIRQENAVISGLHRFESLKLI